MTAAMRHPAYKDPLDDIFRDAVQAKLVAMDNNRVQSTVYGSVEREITNTNESEAERAMREADHRASEEVLASIRGSSEVRPRNEREQRAADVKEAEQLLAAQYGASAIRPAAPSVKIDFDAGYGFQRRD